MRTPALPVPGECHPDFRDRRWLHDWIAGTGGAAIDRVQLPEWVGAPPHGLGGFGDGRLTVRVLVKRRAFGMAPYVGAPFLYVWHFATDELGRTIASDARIVHTDGAHRSPDVFQPAAAEPAERIAVLSYAGSPDEGRNAPDA